ncbi:MAG TPA: HEAT repeat domain-containing protein [Gemmatimonadales bacterium]|nr:HEAT repeat domain-containing protein [Gemmatimonadales bacterium]
MQLGFMLAGLMGLGIVGTSQAPAASQAAAVQSAEAFRTVPRAAWLHQDPGDSLYRAAREALTRGRYQEAASLFGELVDRYPQSGYVADSLYWRAFALYRVGGSDNLRQSLALLEQQQSRFPKAENPDAPALATRIRGELARLGDPQAAAVVAAEARSAAPVMAPTPPTPPNAMAAPAPARPAVAPRVGRGWGPGDECANEDDMKLAALNALLQMDSDRAVPILQKVLARRDSSSTCLRRRAVFLLAQKETDQTGRMLLDVVRNDPDPEVRGQAVFWLSQVQGDAAVAALDSVIRATKDPELQKKALFALGQQSGPKAAAALRAFAERDDVPEETRSTAVFWLGQKGRPEDAAFLRSLYSKTKNEQVKKRILFSVSQSGEGADNTAWLVKIARDTSEDLEQRKQALFWAGQSGASTATMTSLYATMPGEDMKKQLIFVLGQRHDPAAVDKLIDIARNEKDPELKRSALFWLGQSDDPRVTKLLEDLLTQP